MGFGCSVRSLNKKQSKNSNSNSERNEINSKVLSAYERNKKVTSIVNIDFSKPRDLYNRQNLLQNSLEKVNELPNPDKDDILIHIQHLTDNRMAALTIIRNISILLTFRTKLGKPFRDATITDMRAAFTKIENEGWKTKKGEIKEYSSWADKKFRDVIKKFYKVVFGNNEDYPEVVKWIKTKFTKDKSVKKLDMNKFLSEEQIKKLIHMTIGLQRKTLLAIGYELGARPGELLALVNLCLREEDGELFCTISESKTKERVIKIVEYKLLLKQWLANHPLKHLPVFHSGSPKPPTTKTNPWG